MNFIFGTTTKGFKFRKNKEKESKSNTKKLSVIIDWMKLKIDTFNLKF